MPPPDGHRSGPPASPRRTPRRTQRRTPRRRRTVCHDARHAARRAAYATHARRAAHNTRRTRRTPHTPCRMPHRSQLVPPCACVQLAPPCQVCAMIRLWAMFGARRQRLPHHTSTNPPNELHRPHPAPPPSLCLGPIRACPHGHAPAFTASPHTPNPHALRPYALPLCPPSTLSSARGGATSGLPLCTPGCPCAQMHNHGATAHVGGAPPRLRDRRSKDRPRSLSLSSLTLSLSPLAHPHARSHTHTRRASHAFPCVWSQFYRSAPGERHTSTFQHNAHRGRLSRGGPHVAFSLGPGFASGR